MFDHHTDLPRLLRARNRLQARVREIEHSNMSTQEINESGLNMESCTERLMTIGPWIRILQTYKEMDAQEG